MSEFILIAFYFVIFVYSVIIHEISHGVMALWLGDSTAKYEKRITLNPISHIDPWLTIITPILILIMTGGRFAFGGARPVPYNPYNLKNQKWGPLLVALAGPLSNILIASIFVLIAKAISIPLSIKSDIINNFNDWSGISIVVSNSIGAIFFEISIMVIFWNVLLAFFNLIPFPPLDGSKLLYPILGFKTETIMMLEQYGFVLLFAVIVLDAYLFNILGLFLGLMWGLFFQMTM